MSNYLNVIIASATLCFLWLTVYRDGYHGMIIQGSA